MPKIQPCQHTCSPSHYIRAKVLNQIPFSKEMLCQIPFSCYTWFRYTWFRYTWFLFIVMPDSRIKFPCYAWFRYTTFCYTTFHFHVITDSVVPVSVMLDSLYPSYAWFRYTTFCYALVRYTRFPIPIKCLPQLMGQAKSSALLCGGWRWRRSWVQLTQPF